MQRASSWYDYYANRDPERYYRYCVKRYTPFISAVAKTLWAGALVLEVGSGMGTITRVLRNCSDGSQHFMCSDIDPNMVALTKKHVQHDVHCFKHDIRIPCKYVDVVHGHGVLEHMSDADIRCSIEAHRASGASYAFHYVPSHLYDEPSFGDERLLSAQEWGIICKPSMIIPFNNDYDYALVWRFQNG